MFGNKCSWAMVCLGRYVCGSMLVGQVLCENVRGMLLASTRASIEDCLRLKVCLALDVCRRMLPCSGCT